MLVCLEFQFSAIALYQDLTTGGPHDGFHISLNASTAG